MLSSVALCFIPVKIPVGCKYCTSQMCACLLNYHHKFLLRCSYSLLHYLDELQQIGCNMNPPCSTCMPLHAIEWEALPKPKCPFIYMYLVRRAYARLKPTSLHRSPHWWQLLITLYSDIYPALMMLWFSIECNFHSGKFAWHFLSFQSHPLSE